ncbi:MAG TPA: winged helix-turn-helix domain-containing protein [Hyphomicrobiaceae bacterium]|jgi:DNA-binding winged helix-turn-helix (wHTH) protein
MSMLRFGAFTLDPARGAVFCEGQVVELRTQSFAVLSHLASNPGRLVSKDELFDAIWRDAEVTPDSLVQCITEIRKAVGDTDHRIIKTVRGKGYRFVAEISPVVPASQTAADPDPGLSLDASPPTVPPQPIWQAPVLALALLIAALAGASTWLLWNHIRPRPPVTLTMMAVPSIAVLPFTRVRDDVGDGKPAVIPRSWRWHPLGSPRESPGSRYSGGRARHAQREAAPGVIVRPRPLLSAKRWVPHPVHTHRYTPSASMCISLAAHAPRADLRFAHVRVVGHRAERRSLNAASVCAHKITAIAGGN